MPNSAFGGKLNLCGTSSYLCTIFVVALVVDNNQPRPEAVVLGRPPEGADYVRLPPLGAWSWSGPSFLPGTGRGFSVDDDFQAYPLSCESLPKP